MYLWPFLKEKSDGPVGVKRPLDTCPYQIKTNNSRSPLVMLYHCQIAMKKIALTHNVSTDKIKLAIPMPLFFAGQFHPNLSVQILASSA